MNTNSLIVNAKDTLESTFEKAKELENINPKIKKLIDSVLGSGHKTYKYILFTALLAKTTDNDLNPVALQAGADVNGAYDARSVCHRVVVPFERKFLRKALGGSNEPFLNKPARYPMLAKDNAVRRGSDQDLLFALCDGLPELKTSTEAEESLIYLLQLLIATSEQEPFRIEIDSDRFSDEYSAVSQFLDSLLNHNSGGEILTLVVTASLQEFFHGKEEYLIEPHNTNQSGASSREVSDLDVYRNGEIFALFELKDKNFSVEDVEHAVQKALDAGFNTLNFVHGRSVQFDKIEVEALRQELLYESFTLNVLSADPFIWTLLSLVSEVSLTRVTQNMVDIIENCNFSQNSKLVLSEVAKKFLN